MYQIERLHYGFKLIFAETISADQMKEWVSASEKVLAEKTGTFGVFVDMRTLKPLQPEAQEHMKTGQKLFKEKGMQRSAVILNDAIITLQFKRIAKETGIYAWERYIDASKFKNWEEIGINWLTKGIDPDL